MNNVLVLTATIIAFPIVSPTQNAAARVRRPAFAPDTAASVARQGLGGRGAAADSDVDDGDDDEDGNDDDDDDDGDES